MLYLNGIPDFHTWSCFCWENFREISVLEFYFLLIILVKKNNIQHWKIFREFSGMLKVSILFLDRVVMGKGMRKRKFNVKRGGTECYQKFRLFSHLTDSVINSCERNRYGTSWAFHTNTTVNESILSWHKNWKIRHTCSECRMELFINALNRFIWHSIFNILLTVRMDIFWSCYWKFYDVSHWMRINENSKFCSFCMIKMRRHSASHSYRRSLLLNLTTAMVCYHYRP